MYQYKTTRESIAELSNKLVCVCMSDVHVYAPVVNAQFGLILLAWNEKAHA